MSILVTQMLKDVLNSEEEESIIEMACRRNSLYTKGKSEIIDDLKRRLPILGKESLIDLLFLIDSHITSREKSIEKEGSKQVINKGIYIGDLNPNNINFPNTDLRQNISKNLGYVNKVVVGKMGKGRNTFISREELSKDQGGGITE
ncbi:hypothetical protein NSQ76_20645 [Bacillus sp. FSL M8-0256]|uniref:hypothetical protein n=1 Tax=Bacillus TaxID=1386 RepID=UPI0013BE7F14|nr:hypothetical protein [Bacillus subtilis]KAF2423349.1 hypothetical protein B6K89_16120 [Bacillus subtilis]